MADKSIKKDRIWEIDALRGIAIILMIAFHLIYDLKEFYSYGFDYSKGFWYYEGKVSAILFILLSGISANLSRNSLRRGIKVFFYGILVTIVTYCYNPQLYIRFGILHLLGFSMIVQHYMGTWGKKYLLLSSIGTISFGFFLAKLKAGTSLLLALGLTPTNFASFDYYPIFPWTGVFIFGVFLGKIFYADKKSLIGKYPSHEPISFLGRHSLTIYLLHQPILLALLYILHGK